MRALAQCTTSEDEQGRRHTSEGATCRVSLVSDVDKKKKSVGLGRSRLSRLVVVVVSASVSVSVSVVQVSKKGR